MTANKTSNSLSLNKCTIRVSTFKIRVPSIIMTRKPYKSNYESKILLLYFSKLTMGN